MLEDGVAKHSIDGFPVPRDQALFVQVDEIALDLLVIVFIHRCLVLLASRGQIVTNLATLHLLEGVAERLQLLDALLS